MFLDTSVSHGDLVTVLIVLAILVAIVWLVRNLR